MKFKVIGERDNLLRIKKDLDKEIKLLDENKIKKRGMKVAEYISKKYLKVPAMAKIFYNFENENTMIIEFHAVGMELPFAKLYKRKFIKLTTKDLKSYGKDIKVEVLK